MTSNTRLAEAGAAARTFMREKLVTEILPSRCQMML